LLGGCVSFCAAGSFRQNHLNPAMDLHADPRLPSSRLALLRYGIAAVGVLLLVGFWQLQVVRSDYYAELAERNRIRTLPLMAPRGLIQDREGRTLVNKSPPLSAFLC